MSAPQELLNLLDRFDQHRDDYVRGRFNETQLRRDYLDPFFEILGWDVANKKGHAEAYREVIHEDVLRIDKTIKAPDYSFRIGSDRKFFVEAKKPGVNIKDDYAPAYQVRRYAWSAKLPLSLLTDFEEWAVYDTRVKPDRLDRATVARIQYFRFNELPDKWDDFSGVFSREAILRGSFDKYAESTKTKKGTTLVDDEFLVEIDSWREMLAQNIALRNADLSQRDLNFAVQRTIDRIIFLRICEDRGIEEYGRLKELKEGKEVYPRLVQLFHQADAKYNSGLFHFRKEKGEAESPDQLTTTLKIDDKILKDIARRLYYPDSPYEFSVFTASILGHVYERFLGKVIVLDKKHKATVEEKPEVRKAGGVYYTPDYVSKFIVANTVGKLVENKEPNAVSEIRVLDPACGSGSFLIAAFDYLLDWHLRYYLDNDPTSIARKKGAPIYKIVGGDGVESWRLTTLEKRRILLNNIYGVDIDQQAVEVTKLSLLLKVLENESEQTLGAQMKLLHERVLPDLGNNIKNGNSLIGPEFYDEYDATTEAERARINAFDWKNEFPTVMKAGGFDAVIGNPPYIRIQAMKEWAPIEVEHYKSAYTSASKGNYDIYVVFVERALELLGRAGRLGLILPHKFFNARYGEQIREVLSAGQHLNKVIHFGHQQIFSGAATYTCLLFAAKSPQSSFSVAAVDDVDLWRTGGETRSRNFPAASIGPGEWNFNVGADAHLYERLQVGIRLGEVAHIFVGLQTSADDVYVVDNDAELETPMLKPFLTTGGLKGYSPPEVKHRLVFPYRLIDGRAVLIDSDDIRNEYPETWAYLKSHETRLRNRDGGKWDRSDWYAFGRSQNLSQMEAPKLIIQVTALRPTVLLDEHGVYMTGGGSGPFYCIRPRDHSTSLKYLLGILNSSLFGYIISKQSTPLRGGYIKFSKQYIETAPIVVPGNSAVERKQAGRLDVIVERNLDLHKKLASAKTAHETTMIQREIDDTDRRIDALVYELYGLTDDEIAIVESTGSKVVGDSDERIAIH